MNTCIECGKELSKNQRKFCSKAHGSNWRNRNVYAGQYQQDYRERSPRNYLGQLRSYHNRRETLSLEFLVALYDKQDGKCAITGIPMTTTQRGGKVPTNISIDRIDSNLGYTEDNIQLICHRVNTMKFEHSMDELKEWCHKILYQCSRPVTG